MKKLLKLEKEYRLGREQITDFEYDTISTLRDYGKVRSRNTSIQFKKCKTIQEANKMLNLQNLKKNNTRFSCPLAAGLVIQPKIDGIFVRAHYSQNGRLIGITTKNSRLSARKRNMLSGYIPKQIYSGERRIDGELFMSKADFNPFKGLYMSPRSVIAAWANTKQTFDLAVKFEAFVGSIAIPPVLTQNSIKFTDIKHFKSLIETYTFLCDGLAFYGEKSGLIGYLKV